MYKELSKTARKELINRYVKTQKGKTMASTLNRLLIEGVFCFACFIVILFAVLLFDLAWWYWFFAGLTVFCGTVFLVGQSIIRNREYNRFFQQLSKNEKNKLTKLQ